MTRALINDSAVALSLQNLIFTFAGLPITGTAPVTAPTGQTATMLEIQSLCMKEPLLAEEFYLRVIKSLNGLPVEVAERASFLLWQLLALGVGCIKPSSHYVIEVLKAFFKLHSMISLKSSAVERIKEIAKHSVYCLRCLPGLLSTVPRKFLVSSIEIECVKVAWRWRARCFDCFVAAESNLSSCVLFGRPISRHSFRYSRDCGEVCCFSVPEN